MSDNPTDAAALSAIADTGDGDDALVTNGVVVVPAGNAEGGSAQQGLTASLTASNTELQSKVSNMSETISKYKTVVTKMKEKMASQAERAATHKQEMDSKVEELTQCQNQLDTSSTLNLQFASLAQALWPLLRDEIKTALYGFAQTANPTNTSMPPTGSQWWTEGASLIVEAGRGVCHELVSLRETHTEQSSTLATLQQQVTGLRDVQSILTASQAKAHDTGAQLDTLNATIVTLTAKNTATEQKLGQLKHVLLKANKRMEEQKRRMTAYDAELQAAQQRIATLRAASRWPTVSTLHAATAATTTTINPAEVCTTTNPVVTAAVEPLTAQEAIADVDGDSAATSNGTAAAVASTASTRSPVSFVTPTLPGDVANTDEPVSVHDYEVGAR
jgi:uncharacterized protein YhaN